MNSQLLNQLCKSLNWYHRIKEWGKKDRTTVSKARKVHRKSPRWWILCRLYDSLHLSLCSLVHENSHVFSYGVDDDEVKASAAIRFQTIIVLFSSYSSLTASDAIVEFKKHCMCVMLCHVSQPFYVLSTHSIWFWGQILGAIFSDFYLCHTLIQLKSTPCVAGEIPWVIKEWY